MADQQKEVATTTLPMIRKTEADFRKGGSGERGAALAKVTNGVKAARRAETGVKARPNPATGEPEYQQNQTDFLMAVAAWKTRTGVKFPLLSDYLDIAESLGWRREDRTWPSDRADRIEVAATLAEAEAETVAA